MRSQTPSLERLDRQIEVVGRAGRRGEVQHAVELFTDVERSGDVVPNEREVVVLLKGGDVLRRARYEVVDADDVVALKEEPVGQV